MRIFQPKTLSLLYGDSSVHTGVDDCNINLLNVSIMKRLITLTFAAFAISGLQAQVRMYPNGNVGIQSSAVPEASLVVGGDASHTGKGFKSYVKANHYLFHARREGAYTNSEPWLVACEGNNFVDGINFYIGTKGCAFYDNPVSRGRAWGIIGEAGNATSGFNYAVHGNLKGSQYGASILGTLDDLDICVPGRYVGYFMGDVRATGNIYGTVLTPSASSSVSMGRSAVMPLSVESDGANNMSVGEKFSRLTAVQYNLSEPQMAQTFAAAGDTAMAAVPHSVTDAQALEKTHYGLDAEVLKEVYPDLVYESQEGDLCINYTEMIPLLVQYVNELRAQVISLQEAQTYNVRNQSEEKRSGNDMLDMPLLEQNDPNPFTQTTVVRYTLPESVQSAFLYIYDLNGTQIDQKTLEGRGKSSVTLEAGSLAPGMYLYALIADGKVIDTKRMIITK